VMSAEKGMKKLVEPGDNGAPVILLP
jgi:hypothetical protein